jgi:hypothetical protein
MVAGSGPLAPATSVEHSSAPYVEHLRLGDIVLACRQGLTGAIRNSVDLSPVDVAHEDIDILLSGTGLWGGQYYYPSFVSVRRWPGPGLHGRLPSGRRASTDRSAASRSASCRPALCPSPPLVICDSRRSQRSVHAKVNVPSTAKPKDNTRGAMAKSFRRSETAVSVRRSAVSCGQQIRCS